MDNLKIWHKFLETIKPQVSPVNFKGWFSQIKLDSIKDDKITFSAPHAFIKETLTQRHLPLMEKAVEDVMGKKMQVEITVKKQSNTRPDEEEGFFQPIQPTTSALNPKYTLENFVVGLSNNLAYAAAQAVVQNPGVSYNPLFVYGGTGVGKTHLMLGIGNALLKTASHLKIIYCSSEKFMNDYVEAIQTHRMGNLRTKYRSAHVLLIDDIQFFSGREGTQEEFFHTFNELQGKNSQIVLTSDRPPNEIAKLEDRLKSRFAGGLMVDIQFPDFDTRVAILQAKCAERGESLPEESLKLIASSMESNIRELEGKLIQLLQALKTHNLPPTAENIAPYLSQQVKNNLKIDHKKILDSICAFFNLSLKDLAGPKRQKELVLPRHLAMYILCEELNMTVEKIGQILGGRDHTTVMHGRDRIKQLVNSDREVQRLLIEVRQKAIS
ncbi:chromosomal replication initiator protein DnaA [Candidatus Daviesbacteria bacterium]|nr:chromosomal replication initiator protein DnaA [Candidatus Daviesbacteria bacterium]